VIGHVATGVTCSIGVVSACVVGCRESIADQINDRSMSNYVLYVLVVC
jgi:hypothetical protein